MNKKILLATISSIAISGCATDSSNTFETFQPNNLNDELTSGYIEQKSNTLYVINDSSSSMSDKYLGTEFPSESTPTKLAVEKELLSRLNHTLPEVSLSSGLRSFGFGPCLSWGATELNQPVQSHSTASFDSAINSLECSSGGTPVESAFAAASTDLASASGNVSVILLSDGHNYEVSPATEILELKEKMGDKFCLSTIWVGNEAEEEGQAVLEQLSALTGCGISTTAGALATADGMQNFVKNVFFNSVTPTVAPLVTTVTVKDEDGDGVPDSKDRCPNTPKGAVADRDGCWAFHGVLFDLNETKIKTEYSSVFDNSIKVLKLNPGLTIEIQGHTDSTGTEGYNQKLSERRAESAKQYLVNNGIDSARIATKGFGESDPVSSNSTKEGRAHNRRVVFKRTDI